MPSDNAPEPTLDDLTAAWTAAVEKFDQAQQSLRIARMRESETRSAADLAKTDERNAWAALELQRKRVGLAQ